MYSTIRNGLLAFMILTAACLSGLITDEEDIPWEMAIPGAVFGIMGIVFFSKKRYQQMKENGEHPEEF